MNVQVNNVKCAMQADRLISHEEETYLHVRAYLGHQYVCTHVVRIQADFEIDDGCHIIASSRTTQQHQHSYRTTMRLTAFIIFLYLVTTCTSVAFDGRPLFGVHRGG